jgi:hypothetical protein
VKTELGNYFKLPNPGLNSFLDSTERGQPDDYRTPMWNKAPREEVLAAWQKVVDAIDVDSQMPGLRQIEEQQKEKVGPYSIMKPFEERKDDVLDYFTTPSKHDRPIPREVIKLVKRELRKGSLSLKSDANVLDDMKLSTNSGSPYFGKRRNVIESTFESSHDDYEYAAVLGWRGQPGGIAPSDVKQRVVWMFPFKVNIKELAFYQPLTLAWQTDNTFPALISLRDVEIEMTKLFDSKADDDLVIATDFTKFDQSINIDDAELAHELILYQFNRKDHEQISETFWIKYDIPIVCTEDITVIGAHGMASGSGGTNADENLIHKTYQHMVAYENGEILNPHSMCLGDDGVLSYPGITVEQVTSSYTARGKDMNVTKQFADEHSTVYLQRYYHTQYRDSEGIMLGVYPTFRALGRLLGQERYYDPSVWSNEMVIIRSWSILENCNNSPLFEQFVDFVIKGDKYELGLKLPGFFEHLDEKFEKAREVLPDLLSYTQGQEYEGKPLRIRDWRIFKYLSSKRSTLTFDTNEFKQS